MDGWLSSPFEAQKTTQEGWLSSPFGEQKKEEPLAITPKDVVPEEPPSFWKDVVLKTGKDIAGGFGTLKDLPKAQPYETVVQSVRGLGQGVIGFGASALTQTMNMAEQLATQGDVDWEAVKVAGDEQKKIMEYSPTDPGAQVVLGAIGSVPTGVKTFFDVLADRFENKPNIYAGLKTIGDMAELYTYGKVLNIGKKGKTELPTKAEPLDTTFAKDLIQQRIAKQRVEGKPLTTLARREGDVAEQTRLSEREAQVKSAFTEIPKAEEILRRQVKEHEGPPTEINVAREPTTIERLEAIARGEEVPLSEQFLKTAQERVGGKYGISERPVEIVVDNRTNDYGLKINDRTLPPNRKKQAQDIVNKAKLQGKTAEDAAKVLAAEFYKVESIEGANLLKSRLQVEETIGKFEERSPGTLPEPKELNFLEKTAERLGGRVGRIVKDVNTVFGEKGSIGDLGKLTPEQQAAYIRLKGELEKLKANAERTGKTLEKYLTDLKVDPKTAAMLARKSEDLPKYAGSINLEKQKIPEDLKQAEADLFSSQKHRVQTWAETDAAALEILKDPIKSSTIMTKAKHGKALTAIEIRVAKYQGANSIARIKEAAGRTPEEFKATVEKERADILNPASEAFSESGRSLNIQKKEYSIQRMIGALGKLKKELNDRQLKALKELDTDNPIEIKNFLNNLDDPKVSDYFLEYWYNSILSGPPTHVVNIVGNTGWLAFQVPHRGIHAAIDLPYAKLTGKQRTAYMNEIFPMLAGYGKGFKKGKVRAGEMIKTGKLQSEFESKWAQEMQFALGAWERSPNATIRKMAKYINPPTKALRAMDVWNNSIASDGHIHSLARRAANEKGLKGKAREAFEKDFIEHPSDATIESTIEQAQYSTFMDRPDPATQVIINVRNVPVVGPALKFTVLPFVNTISNLVKRGLEMTPGVGLLKEGISRGMRAKTGKPFHSTPEVLAKQVEGAILAYYVWQKAAAGDITGDMPKSRNERDQWYRIRKMPWSIRFGGKVNPETGEKEGGTWLSYRRIEPFNTVVAATAIAYDKVKNRPDDEKFHAEIFLELADAMKNNVIDGSYFQGMQTLLNRHQSSKRLVSSVARFTASWIPYSSFWRSMVRVAEVATEGKVTVKKGNEWMKAFSTTIPGLAQYADVPKKLDIWGEESVIPGNILQQWLPYKWSQEKTDVVENELEKLNIYPGLPSQTVTIKGEKVELDDDIYTEYAKDLGHKLYGKIKTIISKDTYQAASKRDGEKAYKRHRKRIEAATDGVRHTALEKAKRKQREKQNLKNKNTLFQMTK